MDSQHVEQIAVIGLGKLGGSMAAAIAHRGFNVIGVDVNEQAVHLLNSGHAPAPEMGLEELVAENRARLRATTSHREAILAADVCFIVVPTPSDPRGSFSLQYAKWAFQELGKALREKERYTLIVMSSTVLPGSCRYGLIPVLEQASGKKAGVDFGFCYSPEFIALGSVIRNFLNPDFTLVGELDSRSGSTLEGLYGRIMDNAPLCQRMSLENAELAKVSLNSYVTMKIAFANTLAEICQAMPGGDVDAVTKAIGLDSRIGNRFLKGGMGFGGPCFPRDNVAFSFIAKELGIETDLALATDRLNQRWLDNSVDRIRALMPRGKTVAILGLAYKPGTPVLEASQSMMLADRLNDAGYRVIAYDPMAGENARAEFRHRVVVQDTLARCLEGADVVAVTTTHPEFLALRLDDFSRCSQPVVVYDVWRTLGDVLDGHSNILWVPYGREAAGGHSAAKLAALWASD